MMKWIFCRSRRSGRQGGLYAVASALEIKDLFREWLDEHEPGRAKHVMSLIRSMRGGKATIDLALTPKRHGSVRKYDCTAFRHVTRRLGTQSRSEQPRRVVFAACQIGRSTEPVLHELMRSVGSGGRRIEKVWSIFRKECTE